MRLYMRGNGRTDTLENLRFYGQDYTMASIEQLRRRGENDGLRKELFQFIRLRTIRLRENQSGTVDKSCLHYAPRDRRGHLSATEES